MKRVVLILFICSPFINYGQVSSVQPTRSFGIIAYSNAIIHNGITNVPNFINYYCNGLQYKTYNNKNALRVSFQYSQREINDHPDWICAYYEATGNEKGFSASVGLEHSLFSKKFSLFLYSDGMLTESWSNIHAVGGGWGGSFDEVRKSNLTAMGIVPGVGFKYSISKKVFISGETGASLFYYYLTDRIKNEAIDNGIGISLFPVRSIVLGVSF